MSKEKFESMPKTGQLEEEPKPNKIKELKVADKT